MVQDFVELLLLLELRGKDGIQGQLLPVRQANSIRVERFDINIRDDLQISEDDFVGVQRLPKTNLGQQQDNKPFFAQNQPDAPGLVVNWKGE